MTLEEIKADIIDACQKFIAAGNKLEQKKFDVWDDAENAVEGETMPCGGCAMTALGVVKCGVKVMPYPDGVDINAIDKAVGERYGWSRMNREAFTRGFDGSRNVGVDDQDIYNLGVEVRKAVLP